MSQSFRLADGGRIDRSRVLHFTFNGQNYEGYPGDTLASALFANGVRLVGRSFKYHRPRGIMTAGSEEPSGLVQLETGAHTEPNLRATQIELYDGLSATSINAWPSVDFDIGEINSLLSRIFVAGFYYKTFMGPAGFWNKIYEPIIRRAAGLGRAPEYPDPDIYDHQYVHADVLIAGAGPAGIAAALAAARTGARVVLADEQSEFGGSLLHSGESVDGLPGSDWIAGALDELRQHEDVTLLPRTTVFGYYDNNYIAMVERRTDHLGPLRPKTVSRHRAWHVRAKRVVIATGAHERPMVFGDNDRPGILLAEAGRVYTSRYAVKPGERAVLFTNNDNAYRSAIDMHLGGMPLDAIVDIRARPGAQALAWADSADVEVLPGSSIIGTAGRKSVIGVDVMATTPDGIGISGGVRRIDCDTVLMSGGWTPAIHLFSQSGGKLRYDSEQTCFLPETFVQACRVVGSANGTRVSADCLAEAAEAGHISAREAGFRARARKAPKGETVDPGGLQPAWVAPSDHPTGKGPRKHFVDFQNDVTAGDLMLAAREGFHSVEHLKRYTTTGMGTDQGKTSNINALAILAREVNNEIPKVGTTTFRPPYTPVSYGSLAGRNVGHLSDPVRKTPMHDWHEGQGAAFEIVGQWLRPWYYPQAGETMQQAVNRECLAVRNAVGLLDATTLGKIDIQGPDAAEFLNRIYTNAWKKLGIGRCRYGLMCHEDGMIFDDGVTTRLGENHFIMTTTSGNAAQVLDWLEEYLQTEWPDLKVYCTSVTEQFATISIAGPKSREVLQKLSGDIDLSAEAFPFMSMQAGEIAGAPARIFRISFTGELSYEINVPAFYGRAVWQAVMQAGKAFGITPYGTETMHVLRAEKGFIIVGQETDGTVVPQDLGMDWIVSKQKPDFIGKRSFSRPDTARSDRKQLVGLLTVADGNEVLPEGAQITEAAKGVPPVPMLGHVTSSYYSPTLGHSIALALIKDGRSRIGEELHAPLESRAIRVRVVEPVFFDPKGERANG
ncbi:MAG: sarcosine oxidase subunit alpha [Rhodospirillales bacterium]